MVNVKLLQNLPLNAIMLAPEVSDFRLERPKTSVSSHKRDDKLPPKLVSPFTNIAYIVS